MNLEVRTQTHKPDQTKINIYRFDMAKSAAQRLYGPVLVCVCPQKPQTNSQNKLD